MFAALTEAVLVALCCFTPILVILMGTVGLSSFTPYIDQVLLPALVIMIVLTVVSHSTDNFFCYHLGQGHYADHHLAPLTRS